MMDGNQAWYGSCLILRNKLLALLNILNTKNPGLLGFVSHVRQSDEALVLSP